MIICFFMLMAFIMITIIGVVLAVILLTNKDNSDIYATVPSEPVLNIMAQPVTTAPVMAPAEKTFIDKMNEIFLPSEDAPKLEDTPVRPEDIIWNYADDEEEEEDDVICYSRTEEDDDFYCAPSFLDDDNDRYDDEDEVAENIFTVAAAFLGADDDDYDGYNPFTVAAAFMGAYNDVWI